MTEREIKLPPLPQEDAPGAIALDQREWISIEDHVPKTDIPVIVAYKAKNRYSIITARYSGNEWRFLFSKQQTRLPEKITHWMHLPSAPAQESERKG